LDLLDGRHLPRPFDNSFQLQIFVVESTGQTAVLIINLCLQQRKNFIETSSQKYWIFERALKPEFGEENAGILWVCPPDSH